MMSAHEYDDYDAVETLEVGKSTSKSKSLKSKEDKKRSVTQGNAMCGAKSDKACCSLF